MSCAHPIKFSQALLAHLLNLSARNMQVRCPECKKRLLLVQKQRHPWRMLLLLWLAVFVYITLQTFLTGLLAGAVSVLGALLIAGGIFVLCTYIDFKRGNYETQSVKRQQK